MHSQVPNCCSLTNYKVEHKSTSVTTILRFESKNVRLSEAALIHIRDRKRHAL